MPSTGVRADEFAKPQQRLLERLASALRTRSPNRSILQLLFVLALLVNIAVNLFWVGSAAHGAKDLDSFLHSGAAYGAGLNPYAYHPNLEPQPISEEALNLNPPISVYLFEPLSRLEPEVARGLFLVGSAALFTVAFGALLRAYPEKQRLFVVLTVFAMAGFWHMLWFLQLYAPLIMAMIAAWLLMRRDNLLLAGILLGVVIAIKPNYALVLPVLLAAGHWRVSASAMVSAGVISFVPLAIDGPQIYRQWIELTLSFEGFTWPSNASLVSVGSRFGVPALGHVAAVALVVGVLHFQWRYRPGLLDSTAIGVMTVLLFGPVSWAGYTLLLLPYLISRPWDRLTWVAVLLLATPFAPDRVSDAVGGDALLSLHLTLPSLVTAAAAPVLDAMGSLLKPFVGSIYAWAVLLLLGTHLLRTARTGALHLPMRRPIHLPSSRIPASRAPARAIGSPSVAVYPHGLTPAEMYVSDH